MADHALPRFALSIRQPWAWAIIHAGKDIENRDWNRSNPSAYFRGPFAVHASTGLTHAEYRDAAAFIERACGLPCPAPADLVRGAIIGSAVIQDLVKASRSPWFMGPRGLLLQDVKACEPIPCSGRLGFFEWKRGGRIAEPVPWMINQSTLKPSNGQEILL